MCYVNTILSAPLGRAEETDLFRKPEQAILISLFIAAKFHPKPNGRKCSCLLQKRSSKLKSENWKGVETWLLYFTVAEAHVELEAILHGQYLGRLATYYYPIGRCAMWKAMGVFYDPDGFLQSLKRRLEKYPHELAAAVLNHHLKALDDVEDLERAVHRQDVFFYHFALDLALDHFLQAVFALNKEYFPSRKRSESYVRRFKAKPVECEGRLSQVVALGGNAETLEESYRIWNILVSDLRSLVKSNRIDSET
jgi:hypothetical protein